MMDVKKGKRLLILEATYRLFLEHGYTQTKISDIAKEVNIGKGTVYEYFESKEAIFAALFEFFADEYKKRYLELTQQCVDRGSLAKLKLFIQFDLDAIQFMDHTQLPPSSTIELELFKVPGLMPLFQRFMNYKFELVYSYICEGMQSGEFAKIDPMVATVSLLGSLAFYDGFRRNKVPLSLHEKMEQADWTMDYMFQFIFHGLVGVDHKAS